MDGHLAGLISRFSKPGRVEWLGVRPERKADVVPLKSVLITENGLAGDRRATPGKRAVSLIQAEHLPVIAALSIHDKIPPEWLRRNIVVSGINLLGLRKVRFQIGSVILEGTGICAPCSRMEEILGYGGYTAVRGHGGITASVVETGEVKIGDVVVPILG